MAATPPTPPAPPSTQAPRTGQQVQHVHIHAWTRVSKTEDATIHLLTETDGRTTTYYSERASADETVTRDTATREGGVDLNTAVRSARLHFKKGERGRPHKVGKNDMEKATRNLETMLTREKSWCLKIDNVLWVFHGATSLATRASRAGSPATTPYTAGSKRPLDEVSPAGDDVSPACDGEASTQAAAEEEAGGAGQLPEYIDGAGRQPEYHAGEEPHNEGGAEEEERPAFVTIGGHTTVPNGRSCLPTLVTDSLSH